MSCETDREALYHAEEFPGAGHAVRAVHRPLYDLAGRYGYTGYREHAVDIHSHVMPGMDDGAQTMEEAMELLRLDWEEGVRVVFATPHYGIENGYAPDRNDVREGFQRLSRAARDAVLSERKQRAADGGLWRLLEPAVMFNGRFLFRGIEYFL